MGGPERKDGLLIGPDTTVREAVAQFPGIEAVFERYGLGGCGGHDGPIEPIGFFARVHQVDPPQLLRELNAYAAEEPQAAAFPVLDKSPDRRTELYVLGAGAAILLAMLAGFPLGILAALSGPRDIGLGTRWTPLLQAHGHLQVMGFIGLFIIGVAFQVIPRFKQSELAFPRLGRPAIGLTAAGLALRTITQPYSDSGRVADLMVSSAMIEFAGAACFTLVIGGTLLRSRRKNYDWYLLAAAGWLVAAAVANIVVLWQIAADGQSVIPGAKDSPLLAMQLYGFVALFIFGISIRVLPHFLSLRPPSVQWFLPALAIYNAALIARVGTGWWDAYSGWTAPHEIAAFSAYGMAAGALAFLFALRMHLPAKRDEAEDMERSHIKIVRTAYAWLAVAFAIEVWMSTRSLGSWTPDFLQAGAARHALALGFATNMVFGIGARALPVFAGKRLHSRLLLNISFWALNVAVFTRVGSGLLALGAVSSRFDHIAFSGGVAFLALGLFAYNIGRSVLGRPPAAPRPGTEVVMPTESDQRTAFKPGPESIVADVIAGIPGSLELLVEYGFKPLADPALRAKLASQVSLRMACGMHGINLDTLIADLERLQCGELVGSAEQGLINALRGCYDPEIPINIVDLGLVYGVEATEGRARVRMTLTAPDCPAAPQILADVTDTVRALGYEDVEVELVRDPAWEPSRMTPAARVALGWQ